MKGYVIIARNRDDGGIVADVVEDWEDFMEETPRRLIYCQGVGDMEGAKCALDDFIDSYEGEICGDSADVICQQIADLVVSVQWIANDFPIKSFKKQVKKIDSAVVENNWKTG